MTVRRGGAIQKCGGTLRPRQHADPRFEDAGPGFRRVVPSPEPREVIEKPVIESLLKQRLPRGDRGTAAAFQLCEPDAGLERGWMP